MNDTIQFYYQCKRCKKYRTYNKKDMKRHINKVNICKLSDNNVQNNNWREESLNKIIDDINVDIDVDVEDTTTDNNNKCEYCRRVFSRRDCLTRHLKNCLVKICKERDKLRECHPALCLGVTAKRKIIDEVNYEHKEFNDYSLILDNNNNNNNNQEQISIPCEPCEWEIYDVSKITSNNFNYTDFSYYNGLCLLQLPHEEDYRDKHFSNDVKIRLFTSISYPCLLYEFMKNHNNVNIIPENEKTSIVYKKNGFVRMNNDILTLETTLKLKRYFLKNYQNFKYFHPLMDNDLYKTLCEGIYRCIIKKSDIDYKEDYLKIFENNKKIFDINDIIAKNNFRILEFDFKSQIIKKQFIYF